MSYASGGTLRGVLRQMTPVTPPAVSVAGEGRIYFDGTQFQVSENGAAYTPAFGGGGGTLASVLASGNTTGGNPIIVSVGDEIRGATVLTLTTTAGLNTGGLVAVTANSTGDGGSSGAVTLGSGTVDFGSTSSGSTGAVTIRSGAFTGTTNDQGDSTGDINILVGNGTSLTGDNAVGGSVTLTAGSTTNDNATSGSVTINAGGAAGTNSTGGSLTLGAGGGYTAGNLTLSTQVPGPGNGGDITVNCGANMSTTSQEAYSVIAGDGGTNGSIFIESQGGGGDTITLQRNPGTPTTSVVLDDTYFTVNAILMASSIGDGTGNVNVSTQSGSLGGDGTRLFITPNLGIILEIGNTIKIDPDGTNNWIYGDDASTPATAGEPLTLRGGQGNTTGAGGQLHLHGGAGGATGAGADANLLGGAGGATSGNAGAAQVRGGVATDGNGGDAELTGSNGVGTNRNGGSVAITAGNNTGTGTAGVIVFQTAGGTEVGRFVKSGGLQSQITVTPKTAGYTPTSTESRVVFTNEGAGASITFTLPSAVVGLEYYFYVQNANGIVIQAAAGDQIQVSATASSVAGTATSTTTGSCLRLVAINATEWVATSVVGTWVLA